MATCCSSKIGSFYPQSLWHNTHFKPCLGIKCSFLQDQWLPLCLNSFRWAGSLKRGGLRGPRLGPALVFGHQSERHSICPLLNPRLISWRNNAGLGGPSLDAEYDPGRFVLLDGELHGSMGSHALSAKSVFHYVCLVPPTFLSLNLPSLSTPFPGFPLPHWTVSFLQGNYREQLKPTTAAEPLGRSTQTFFFWLLQGLVQDPSLLADQHTVEAAMRVWAHRSSCSHGPTERWAVPLLGDGASERAEDMLGRMAGDHCTEVCYYSIYCSNHGNAMEDWSCLHYHRHRVCHRGRRRSQRWVRSVTRWAEARMIQFTRLTLST